MNRSIGRRYGRVAWVAVVLAAVVPEARAQIVLPFDYNLSGGSVRRGPLPPIALPRRSAPPVTPVKRKRVKPPGKRTLPAGLRSSIIAE